MENEQRRAARPEPLGNFAPKCYAGSLAIAEVIRNICSFALPNPCAQDCTLPVISLKSR